MRTLFFSLNLPPVKTSGSFTVDASSSPRYAERGFDAAALGITCANPVPNIQYKKNTSLISPLGLTPNGTQFYFHTNFSA
tara:strand:- start:244 stop:483 length:240 start_codon:yes stop_codon:yes gene_type:complete